jgi:hypothetical protein
VESKWSRDIKPKISQIAILYISMIYALQQEVDRPVSVQYLFGI